MTEIRNSGMSNDRKEGGADYQSAPPSKAFIRYDWEDTGTVTVELRGNLRARVKFMPSASVIADELNKHIKNADSHSEK